MADIVFGDDEEEEMPVDLTDLSAFNRQYGKRRAGGGTLGLRGDKSTVEKTDQIIRNLMASQRKLSLSNQISC